MKSAFILLGMAMVLPSSAWAQIPTVPPPADAAATLPAPAPAPQPPAAEKAPPGDQYFVEPAPAAMAPAPATEPPPGADAPPGSAPFEPPPPGLVFAEPPPPPVIRHRAPLNSLWLGARLGWFFPFGNVWAQARPVDPQGGSGYVLQGVAWRDYASPGPMFELNAGLRLARSYTVFALWERAQLGAGDRVDDPESGFTSQKHAETDFWAVGLRASSNPDHLGFLTEVAIGYRRARTLFSGDNEVQFTDAPFEARLGLGGELRLNRTTVLSALATIGVGGFGQIEAVNDQGYSRSLIKSVDQSDGHAWATLTVGAHFDLIPSRD